MVPQEKGLSLVDQMKPDMVEQMMVNIIYQLFRLMYENTYVTNVHVYTQFYDVIYGRCHFYIT